MIAELKRLAHAKPASTGQLLVIFAALFTLGGAWYLQVFAGLFPCPLCLEQRIPWYIAFGIAAAALIIPYLAPHATGWRLWALLPNAGLMLWGAYKAGEHVGVEKGWWGSSCTLPSSDGAPLSIEEMMAQGEGDNTVPCDAIQWEMFGITLAQLNLVICLTLAATLLFLFFKALNDREG